MTELRVEVLRRSAGELVIHLMGEIDLANAEGVGDRLLAAVEDEADVLLDLAEVQYLDSAGIRMLDDLARRLGERGRYLALVAPEGSVCRRVLQIAAPGLLLRDG